MTLMRGLELLQILAEGGDTGLGVADICAKSNMHRVTAHRMLAALTRQGWVEQNPERRYQLGIEAWRIGLRANERFDLVKIGDTSLDAIEQETHDTTYLLKRHRNEAVCVARREGIYPLKFLVMDVGVSYPLGVGAATLAILAYLDQDECDAALAETAAQLQRFPRISMKTVRKMLRETRKQGFAFSEGLIVPSACAIALPIFNATGKSVGSLACVASRDRLSGDRQEFVIRTLRREAEVIGVKLGKPANGAIEKRSRSARNQIQAEKA